MKCRKHTWMQWEPKIRWFGCQGPCSGYERICMERKCEYVQWVEEVKPTKRPRTIRA